MQSPAWRSSRTTTTSASSGWIADAGRNPRPARPAFRPPHHPIQCRARARLRPLLEEPALSPRELNHARPTRPVRLDQLLHEARQIVRIERAGAIRARVEEPPELARLFDGVKQQLLFDEVLLQQLLVEAADRSGQDVGHAEILGGDQLRGGFEFDLQNAAAGVDLEKIDALILKAFRPVVLRLEFQLDLRKQLVQVADEIAADAVQLQGRLAAQRTNLVRPADAYLVLAGQCVQASSQFPEAVAARLGRAAGAGRFETPFGLHSYQDMRAAPA